MRLLLPLSIVVVGSILVACSVDSTTTPSQPTKAPASTEPTEEDPAAEETTSSSSGGSSSGGSSSGGSSSGGKSSSSGGSSSGGSSSGGSSSGSTTTCTAPSISGTKTLSELTSTEKAKLCDYNACPFGGYGKSKTCSNGSTVKSKSSQSVCTSDPTWTNCADLAVSDYFSCVDAVNADPCNVLTIMSTDAACAQFKACAF